MRQGIERGSVSFKCLTEQNAINTALKHGFASLGRNSVWKLHNCPTPIHIGSTAYVENHEGDLFLTGSQMSASGTHGIEFNKIPIDRSFVKQMRSLN